MVVLRLFFLLSALLLAASGIMYLVTRDCRYRDFAVRLLRFAAMVILLYGLLFAIERFVLVGWGILI